VEVELEAEDPILRHLVVGQRLLELVDLEQEILADLGHSLDLELLDHVLDIDDAFGVAETLLVEKGNLVIEDVELLEELVFGDRDLDNTRLYIHPKNAVHSKFLVRTVVQILSAATSL
jgi:hypothetical protein